MLLNLASHHSIDSHISVHYSTQDTNSKSYLKHEIEIVWYYTKIIQYSTAPSVVCLIAMKKRYQPEYEFYSA